MMTTPVRSAHPSSRRPFVACLLLLAATTVTPLLAQGATIIPVAGRVIDAAQMPVTGFRVVLRAAGSNDIYLSPPTDEEGSFRVNIPTGVNCVPVAVISPEGKRLPIEGMTPALVMPNTRFDIELEIAMVTARDPRPFGGADRLFLSFVEDATFVEGQRYETDLSVGGTSDATSFVSEFLAAVNFTALPRLEFGGRLGYAGTNFDSGSGATGLTDLEAWGKFNVGSSLKRGTRWAAGFVLRFPTGEQDTGLSYEALQSKAFGAVRFDVGRFTVSANAGLQFNEDATVQGTKLDGRVAGSIGGAALMDFNHQLVGVAELLYEGEPYEGVDADARLLVGVNWKPLDQGMFRLALGFGLTEGAPDGLLILGWAFEF